MTPNPFKPSPTHPRVSTAVGGHIIPLRCHAGNCGEASTAASTRYIGPPPISPVASPGCLVGIPLHPDQPHEVIGRDFGRATVSGPDPR